MNNTSPLRVRFAPSPTGLVHVGNLRGALVCYLLAKQSGGDFILRLEDTDQERFVPEAAKFLTDSLEWLGLNWNEGYQKGGKYGPYVQSERLDIYKKYAEQLVAEGKAYYDYTSSDELDKLRHDAQVAGKPFKFNEDIARLNPLDNEKGVIRFKTPNGPDVVWDDQVWGEQRWSREVLDDFVCIKSDGFPTYNFAVVIDDHLMNIDIVTRGQEFLPTTPKNLLVYEALGWKAPRFAHLPWVLGPDKAKLSKRHGAMSVLEYRDLGYFPDVLVNFLATLGWNDGTEQETFTRTELIAKFCLARVQKSPAIFDSERLDWMNGLYIRNLYSQDPHKLLNEMEHFWPPQAKSVDNLTKKNVLALEYERAKKLSDLSESTTFFFDDPTIDPKTLIGKLEKQTTRLYLDAVAKALGTAAFDHAGLEQALRGQAEQLGTKPGPLFMLIRVAITGKTATPGLFEMMTTLGKETVLRRLKAALSLITD